MVCFVDANIFLEISLKDKRSEECKSFLLKSRKEINIVTSDFIIYSCVLRSQTKEKPLEGVRGFFNFISEFYEMEILRPSLTVMMKSKEFMKKYSLDFDDALVVACMIENKIKQLVSFDEDFDKVKEIERLEPKDVLRNIMRKKVSIRDIEKALEEGSKKAWKKERKKYDL